MYSLSNKHLLRFLLYAGTVLGAGYTVKTTNMNLPSWDFLQVGNICIYFAAFPFLVLDWVHSLKLIVGYRGGTGRGDSFLQRVGDILLDLEQQGLFCTIFFFAISKMFIFSTAKSIREKWSYVICTNRSSHANYSHPIEILTSAICLFFPSFISL